MVIVPLARLHQSYGGSYDCQLRASRDTFVLDGWCFSCLLLIRRTTGFDRYRTLDQASRHATSHDWLQVARTLFFITQPQSPVYCLSTSQIGFCRDLNSGCSPHCAPFRFFVSRNSWCQRVLRAAVTLWLLYANMNASTNATIAAALAHAAAEVPRFGNLTILDFTTNLSVLAFDPSITNITILDGAIDNLFSPEIFSVSQVCAYAMSGSYGFLNRLLFYCLLLFVRLPGVRRIALEKPLLLTDLQIPGTCQQMAFLAFSRCVGDSNDIFYRCLRPLLCAAHVSKVAFCHR